MTEKLVVSVDPSESDPAQVTVQGVFTHVLDVFALLSKSISDPDHQVLWRLVSVNMNSPLTVTAEAVSREPNVNVVALAQEQIKEFRDNISSVRRGVQPRAWSGESAKRARNLFRGGGSYRRTIIRPKSEISRVVPEIEIEALNPVEFQRLEELTALRSVTKTQVGSIDGNLFEVALHYNKPAIHVRDRRTKEEVWCTVPEEFQSEIAANTRVEDVWKGRRVVVSGLMSYDRDGKVSRLEASRIRVVSEREISTDAIQDGSFTRGLSASDYLEKFREGTLD